MEYYNPENKDSLRWAALAVLGYFVMLGVLMLTIKFSLTAEEPTTEGILVEFGDSEMGAGEEELAATDVVATPTPPQVEQQEQLLETDPNQEIALEQQEQKSTSEVQTPPIEQPVQQPDTVVVEKQVVIQEALFSSRTEQSTSSSQGATTQSGNQGAESGGESGATVGGGDGNEASFELKDRSVMGVLYKPDYKSNVTGRVVISIIVDPTGKVTGAAYRAEGSTTNDSRLIAEGRAAALKTRFTPSDNPIQGGTITYIFKMN